MLQKWKISTEFYLMKPSSLNLYFILWRRYKKRDWASLFLLLSISLLLATEKAAMGTETYIAPANPLNDPAFFPLGVWTQLPSNAIRFKKLGINLYVGLWKGPTAQQLQELKEAGMPVICDQNDIALNDCYHDIILGWGLPDEPDNSQKRTFGLIYNPPISPSTIRDHYYQIKTRDPGRPVLLNLGQGVAWDQWEGRGIRTNHPEDYKEYVKGGDIISFDIYPVTHRNSAVRGRLEFVAQGILGLKSLTSPQQKVWNVIGVSRVNDPGLKPTPLQVRSQVWMSIIHGSRGIVYFVHQFKPRFIEAAVFEDPEMMYELTRLNAQIQSLAVVINSLDTNDIRKLTSASPDVPIAAISKRHESSLYLLSVAMRSKEAIGTFEFSQTLPDQEAEVLGENRTVQVRNGILRDHYAPYEPHIYKIDMCPSPASK
jgi:hypothetical protein